MPIDEDRLFRRFREHARKRLVFEPGVDRGQQLPAYKRFLELENEMLKRHHRRGDSGLRVCRARAAMIDVVVENLFLAALDFYGTEHGPPPCKMALIATGGYGRRELNPHSDVDLMFLYPEKAENGGSEKFQEVMGEEILYPLWDLGLRVGHATRNTKDVIEEARRDIQTKNATLESRFISGSRPLYKKMRERFRQFCQNDKCAAYIEQRLREERERHIKAGDSIYLQEPDIKTGPGGLRDYQNILWMAHIKFGHKSFRDLEKADLLRAGECDKMEAAYDFLLRTRTELHLQNRRPTDKLNLEQQPVVAQYLDYPQEEIFDRVEAFMKDYYMAARTIFQTSELLKERLALLPEYGVPPSGTVTFRETLRAHRQLPVKRVDGFILHENTFSTDSETVFEEDPVRLIRLFRLLQQFDARLDPDLKYLLSRSIPLIDGNVINNPSAARAFNSILRCPGEVFPILNRMHELGVLGRYLPEFGALTCMVQHEYYHRYTADAHVLHTIKQLDNVFTKATEIDAVYEKELRKNDDPLLLYLILILHDIGKAEGVQGHAETGVRLARPIFERFEIPEDKQAQISFIIRGHLEMARFWQRFDLDDPRTAASFAEFVEDPQKLRLLYVHTYCDACGTAPTLWNSYKQAMHRTLFERTLEQFEGRDVIEHKRREQREMLQSEFMRKGIEGVSNDEIEAHFSLLPERYFINNDPADIELHLRMINRLFGQIQEADSVSALTPIIDWRDDHDLAWTVVNVITWDRAGLFYKLAGALTLADVNIVSAKAISRSDHITIDTFYIIDPGGGVVSASDARETFETHLGEALVENKELTDAIDEMERRTEEKNKRKKTERKLPASIKTQVDVYHELSLKRTIVEIQTIDRPGLLYRLARLIHDKGFDISFARIATERGIAMDTFYIENTGQEDSGPGDDGGDLLELRGEIETIVGREE